MGSVRHILHVFSTFVPGGPQVRTASLINSLGPGWRHTVMPMDGRFGAEQRIGDAAQVSLRKPPDRKNVPSLANVIREIGPDLLVTYNWGAIEATAAARLYSLCPVIHAEDGFGADEAQGPKFRRALARRLLLNRIRTTVVPSRTLLEIALKVYRIHPGKVAYIPNGIDVSRFRPQRDFEIRRSLGIPDSAALFGFTGHLRPEKNLSLLLQAFAQANLPEARLMLVGDGPCRPELESLARELSVAGRVIFAGHTEDTAPYYGAFDVFVMSSVTEQMPMALLEAMACGLPAVCTNAGDTESILGEPAVPKNDAVSYAEALRRIASDPRMRAEAGAKNRRRVEESYSSERMLREYERLYTSAATMG